MAPRPAPSVVSNDDDRHPRPMRMTVVLGVQGSLVLPVEARTGLGLVPGDELVLHTRKGRRVLEHSERERLRGLCAAPGTRSSVDALLAKRRQAAVAE